MRVRGIVYFAFVGESWRGEGRRRGLFRGSAVGRRVDVGVEQRRRRGQWGLSVVIFEGRGRHATGDWGSVKRGTPCYCSRARCGEKDGPKRVRVR